MVQRYWLDLRTIRFRSRFSQCVSLLSVGSAAAGSICAGGRHRLLFASACRTACFAVDGWTAPANGSRRGWPSVCSPSTPGRQGRSAAARRLSIECGALTFRPRFPLAPGMLRASRLSRALSGLRHSARAVLLPRRHASPQVYPSARRHPREPAQVLHRFSGAMSRATWKHIRS